MASPRKSARLALKNEKADWRKIYDEGVQAVYRDLAVDPRYVERMPFLYRVPDRIPQAMEEMKTKLLDTKDMQVGQAPIFLEISARFNQQKWPDFQYLTKSVFSDDAKALFEKTERKKKEKEKNKFCKACGYTISTFGECCKGKIRGQFPFLILYVPDLGWTLRTLASIPKDSIIGSYTGEILTAKEHSKQDQYDFPITDDFFITSEKKGNEFRFLSHSCDPNLDCIMWETVDSVDDFLFKTRRDVKAGEELTMHYENPEDEQERESMKRSWPKCQCLSCYQSSQRACPPTLRERFCSAM